MSHIICHKCNYEMDAPTLIQTLIQDYECPSCGHDFSDNLDTGEAMLELLERVEALEKANERLVDSQKEIVVPKVKPHKYVVLGASTHFNYNPETNTVWCTHGGWGGDLVIDCTCYIKVSRDKRVEYDSYEFTEASTYDCAVKRGIISLKGGL